MSSTGIDRAVNNPTSYGRAHDDGLPDEKTVGGGPYGDPFDGGLRSSLDSGDKRDHTHRKLKSRHIQLIGIGGTIGTCFAEARFPRRLAPEN